MVVVYTDIFLFKNSAIMKKYLLLLILILTLSLSWGNIYMPRAHVSEILIDSVGSWTIELGFYDIDNTTIDSIRIETSTGSAMIISYTLIEGGVSPNYDFISVITNANLDNPITIDPMHDYIKIISYLPESEYFDDVAIGNYPGSVLDCIRSGESIIYLVYEQSMGYTGSFCIDKSPTIGYGNDTCGALGSFSGKIYNPDGIVFTEGWFPVPQLHNTIIYINSDGTFSERIFSRNYNFERVDIRFQPWPYTVESYKIDAIDFCLRPGSSPHQE